ncbi:hypothetical protein EYF80_046332 [Liparis tanakae]|uniref:Uncharacterized protein n=1 Tax=Liparis tanakae TaxID=230148 RepID=A0A4Z2FRY0_9TELE|nr:hypothetical protein EYF80_046332 [Liparis tanakae]
MDSGVTAVGQRSLSGLSDPGSGSSAQGPWLRVPGSGTPALHRGDKEKVRAPESSRCQRPEDVSDSGGESIIQSTNTGLQELEVHNELLI